MNRTNITPILTRLKAAFERRDRMASQLSAQDVKITREIRRLCDAEGIKFMRVESARNMAFGQREDEAA